MDRTRTENVGSPSAAAPLERPVRSGTLDDAGLRCPRCEYNLTGLAMPRCPECGETFAWDDPRLMLRPTPQIAFEGANGRGRIVGWLVTWLTVLFLPWRFAQQAVIRVRLRDGLFFAGICLAGTPVYLLFDPDFATYGTWLITILIYLPVQAGWLMLIDVANWKRMGASYAFWLAVGGYTSAIVVTEWCTGPPVFLLSDFVAILSGTVPSPSSSILMGDYYQPTWAALVAWSQVTLWLAGLTCVYYARLRRRMWPIAMALPAAALALLGIFVLYNTCLEYVAQFIMSVLLGW